MPSLVHVFNICVWFWAIADLCSVCIICYGVSSAKEPHKRDDILQKRPIILRSLLTVATQYRVMNNRWIWLVGSLKLQVSFAEYRLFYGALLYILFSKVGIKRQFALCCSVLQRVAVGCSVLQCVAVCYSVLQCVAVCCSVLQYVWSLTDISVFLCLQYEGYCHHCNTLQHTATHCNTLCLRTGSHCRQT